MEFKKKNLKGDAKMTFKELSNSGLLWTLVIIGIILVAVITMYYYFICRKHALKCGLSKETVNAVVKSSLTFSIVPSLAICTDAPLSFA